MYCMSNTLLFQLAMPTPDHSKGGRMRVKGGPQKKPTPPLSPQSYSVI